MPFALVTIGIILIVTGVRDTFAPLGVQLQNDFTGSSGFVFWIAAIGSVGALGYIRDLQTFSTAFMTLIVIALLLNEQKSGQTGFFGKFIADLKAGPTCQQAPADTSGAPASPSSTNQGGSGITFSAPTASGNWSDVFKGGPLQNLPSLFGF